MPSHEGRVRHQGRFLTWRKGTKIKIVSVVKDFSSTEREQEIEV